MEGAGLPEKAKTDQKSPEKSIVEDKNWQNTNMLASNGRSRELRSSVGGKRAKWENPMARGTTAGEIHARDGTWELGCRSSCLRWIARLLTSRLVGISH